MVTAVLVSRTGQPVDDAAMEAFCRASLPDYRRPKRFFWIDELPRNSYGKVLKRELRSTLRRRQRARVNERRRAAPRRELRPLGGVGAHQ